MKKTRIGLAAIVAVLAMSFTLASHSKDAKRDNGFYTVGATSCTSGSTTYWERTVVSEDTDCTFLSGVFCYYTVTTASPCSATKYSFTSPKYKIAK